MTDSQTEAFKIIGLVDIFDEQGNITGQYPIGSVQHLPVEFGNKEVELGRAEIFVPEVDETEEEDETAPTGETGEDEVEGDESDEDEDEGDDEDEVE